MTIGSGPPRGAGRLTGLFTPGGRLGWAFRDRRQLIAPFPEPEPDPETVRRQSVHRADAAEKSYKRARKWIARPSLMLATAMLVLVGFVKATHPTTHPAGAIIIAIALAIPGLAWTARRWGQYARARTADPDQAYEQARQQWVQRAAEHERAGLAGIQHLPEWSSVLPPARRTDIFGGTLAGWQSLITVHGASILADQPLLVADLSGQLPSGQLAALARHADLPVAAYLLPRDLNRSGLLARLDPVQFAEALAEAIHAGSSGVRADRAMDVRVLEQLSAALGYGPGGATPARLAAAVQVALGHPVLPGLLAPREADLISGTLFPDGPRPQLLPNLLRIDAFLSDLARHIGPGPPASPPPAYCTCLAIQPGARSARTEMLTALVIQWLTVQVTAGTAATPAVIIAAADEITRAHAERLADACERRGVPLTLLYRHLRDDAALGMIGSGATAFMRLGNHAEAEQAASFIGRQHTFVLSGYTATSGGSQSRGSNLTGSWGTSQGRGSSRTSGWSEDHLGERSASGSRSRTRDQSSSTGWSAGLSEEDGTNWSDATTTERVYEYAVEPAVLQHLPDDALLLVTRNSASPLQAVECHPEIITLPGVAHPGAALHPATTGSRPQIAPRHAPLRRPPQTSRPADSDWPDRRRR
jgi:hypothetical protein